MNENKLTRKSRRSNLEDEQWTIYSVADMSVAVILVLIAVSNAEPPRFPPFPRHQSRHPHQPNGKHPQDTCLSYAQEILPVTNTSQTTRGKIPIRPEDEKIPKSDGASSNDDEVEVSLSSASKLQPQATKPPQQQPVQTAPVYLVLPQSQNYLQQTLPLVVAVPRGAILAPSNLRGDLYNPPWCKFTGGKIALNCA